MRRESAANCKSGADFGCASGVANEGGLRSISFVFHSIIAEAAETFPDDEEAVRWAMEQVRHRPDREKLFDYMEEYCLRKVVEVAAAENAA